MPRIPAGAARHAWLERFGHCSTAASPCDDATGGYLLPFALATIAGVLAALTLIAGRREGRKLA